MQALQTKRQHYHTSIENENINFPQIFKASLLKNKFYPNKYTLTNANILKRIYWPLKIKSSEKRQIISITIEFNRKIYVFTIIHYIKTLKSFFLSLKVDRQPIVKPEKFLLAQKNL